MRTPKKEVRSEVQRKSAQEVARTLSRDSQGRYLARFPWEKIIYFMLGVFVTLVTWYVGYRMGIIDYINR